jgi:MYXO-CTERM domain-containing protein
MDARRLQLLIVVASLVAANGLAAEHEERVIRATEGFRRERAPDELRDPFTLEESRASGAEITVKPRAAPNVAETQTVGDAWIYDAAVELFYDRDADGYYHYLRVQFDADTIRSHMLVYAKIFLSADGVAWEHLYTTDDFRIWGSDPDDDYEVESDLVSGYSTGQYDLLIELYDSAYGDLLDEFGPLESSALSLLPLEDAARDGINPVPIPDDDDGGGGAISWAAVAALAAALAARRRRLWT